MQRARNDCILEQGSIVNIEISIDSDDTSRLGFTYYNQYGQHSEIIFTTDETQELIDKINPPIKNKKVLDSYDTEIKKVIGEIKEFKNSQKQSEIEALKEEMVELKAQVEGNEHSMLRIYGGINDRIAKIWKVLNFL